MKTICLFTLVVVATFLVSFRPIEVTIWKADKPHTNMNFTVTHFLVSEIYGTFNKIDAQLSSSKEDFTDAVFEFEAEASSINTNEEKRDIQLKSPDFFDVEKFKTITFKSTGIKKLGPTKYQIVGQLTMHGTTQSVDLDAFISTGTNTRIKRDFVAVRINGTIKRTSFGIGTSFPDAVISDDIVIKGSSEFVKQ